ncbi:hypothetical protein CVS40_8680 [Lucilia cuprina]|nr:hypothetical protein CVS40_8680 [Lucilia cuprina]
MSIFYKINILFCIFLLKTWKLTQSAAIYYPDYYNLELNDQSNQDFLSNINAPQKRYTNEPKEEYYPQNCRPITYTTSTTLPSTSTSTSSSWDIETNDPLMGKEAQDIIDHIIDILRSMREHAIGLIRNMNALEMDILSSSSSNNVGSSCKNSSRSFSDSMDVMSKIVYPDVLSQTPGYVISEWSKALKTDPLKEVGQTNDFVAEAQEAVKSWKQQIDACKLILDNAVHNALQKVNMKSDLISDPITRANLKLLKNEKDNSYPSSDKENPVSKGFQELTRAIQLEPENRQKLDEDKNHKYQGLYEAFHLKEGDY